MKQQINTWMLTAGLTLLLSLGCSDPKDNPQDNDTDGPTQEQETPENKLGNKDPGKKNPLTGKPSLKGPKTGKNAKNPTGPQNNRNTNNSTSKKKGQCVLKTPNAATTFCNGKLGDPCTSPKVGSTAICKEQTQTAHKCEPADTAANICAKIDLTGLPI